MDKLIFDNADKGMEGAWENLATLQRATIEGLMSIIESLIDSYDSTKIYILKGCEIVIDGSDYTVTAGFIYHDGEVFDVEAGAFTAAGGEVGVWNVSVNSILTPFRNGVNYEVEQQRSMVLESGASGSGIRDHDDTEALVASLDTKMDIENRIQSAIDNLVDTAPGALNTLNELANALGDDENFATTVANALATKLSLSGGTMEGAINMDNFKITGLPIPTDPSDAVRKASLDTKVEIGDVISNQNSVDLDTVMSRGIYYCFNPTNAPTSDEGVLIVTYRLGSSSNVSQVFIALPAGSSSPPVVYNRLHDGASWNAWD